MYFHPSPSLKTMVYTNTGTIKKSNACLLVAGASRVIECHWLLKGKTTWQIVQEEMSSFRFV